MEDFTKVLSHQDRVLGRVISGGIQVSSALPTGKTLIRAIENGFFEKKEIEGTKVAQLLRISFAQFNTFKKTLPN